MEKCKPGCVKTASTDCAGHRIMLSEPGNSKFPIAHTPHPQCGPCALQDCAEAMEQIARQFPDSEEALFARFEKVKAKL
jgi:hypothetical protein